MGATYTRQSTYTEGDTITAAHTNDEFDQLLAAFVASTGHTHDGTAAEGGPVTKLLGTSITIGNATSGTDITVTFDGESNDGVLKWMEDEDYFEFSDDILIATTEKLQFRDTAIYINSSADGQLDLVADTEIQIAATTIDINGLVDISGNLSVGGNLDVTGTFDLSDSNFTNAGDIQLDSISGDADSNTSIAFSGSDVITVTTGGETQITFNNGSILPTTDNDIDLGSSSFEFKDIYIDGTAHLDAINFNGTAISATAAELNIMDGVTSTAAELNILDGVTSTTAELNILDGVTSTATELNLLDGVTSTTAELNILDGVTSTAAELNILDVSNTTIGDLSEISTVANDDVFLAVDTSGGGLKKIARSTVVAGLATSGAIGNVVEDTSPQLGGNLDMNGADIVTTSNATLDLAPNGTGTVVIRGNTNSGALMFNCESNTHGQKVFGQPHSAAVTNNLMLPAGANSTLVSLVSEDTLTNKTLTAPKIADGGFIGDANGNELVVFQTTSSAVNQLEITNNASGSNPILAATGGDTNIGIALTPKGTGEIVIGAGNLNYGGTAVTSTGAELNILDGVTSTAAELNILDGVTSTAAELNTLDGITAVVGELNALDLGSTAVGNAIASKAVILDSNKDFTGLRNVTATGLISGGSLDIDDVLINGSTIGHTDDTDLITVANGLVTVAGEVSLTTLDIGGTNVTSTAAELNILDGVTATATEINQVDGEVVKTAGKESIWVPAAAMYPSTTNPCSDLQQVETTALRPDLKCLDFATGADDFAQFSIAFPKSWNEGTITFQPFWTVTGTNTGTVAWGLAGIAVSNDDSINTAFGTIVVTTALAHSGTSNDLMVSAESGNVTIGGSPAANDLCFFQVNRDVSADDQSGDARLLGIKLFFTTDAKNDS